MPDQPAKTKQGKQRQVEDVMHEFKSGTLKTPSGKVVTDRDQAIAIALNQAGLSHKTLEKAEVLNKIRVYKSQIERMIMKEESKTQSTHDRLLDFFKRNPDPSDDQVHELAASVGVTPHELEQMIYSILSSFLSGGKEPADPATVDPKELEMGVKVEMEHTTDEAIARRIALQHLAEMKDYYTKLKKMESE